MNMDMLNKATDKVKRAFPAAKPLCGIILGSGLGSIVDAFRVRAVASYADIPNLGTPGIEGHSGTLVWAEYNGIQCFIFSGRRHWYEGKGWEPVAVPIAILKTCGARFAIITNAAGGISKDFKAGDIMMIDDHINLMGVNPLVGPHNAFFGPRFPDLTDAYDPDLRSICKTVADKEKIELQQGVYAAVSGPTYETPAEVKAFRAMGADAVGMSTAPEVILAKASGIRVLGLSCIVNQALDTRKKKAITHEEVTSVASELSSNLCKLILTMLPQLAAESKSVVSAK